MHKIFGGIGEKMVRVTNKIFELAVFCNYLKKTSAKIKSSEIFGDARY